LTRIYTHKHTAAMSQQTAQLSTAFQTLFTLQKFPWHFTAL